MSHSANNNLKNKAKMRNLIASILVLFFISPLVYAEQPSNASEEPFEIVVSVTTSQDILDNFGSPLFTTKTAEGKQIWGYRNTKVESVEDKSVPEQDAFFVIEFDKDNIVSNYQIMTENEVFTFQEE